MSLTEIARVITRAKIEIRKAEQALTARGLNPPSEYQARQKLRDAIAELKKVAIQ
jgi:hypothetical protein